VKKPELLAPAGDLNKLKVALTYGADAVYCGLPNFSLRHRENDFSLADLRKAVGLVHEAEKKIYFTVNTYPRDSEFAKLERFLKQIQKTPPDAFIVSDLGVLGTVRRLLPKIALHLSVQANTVNSRTVREWGKLGVKRVILARELSLKEIQKITKVNPKMEFETFVHGAICMSYSGRCFLSMYLSERDANRGQCTQPCRWGYRLEEEKRQGEYFPVEEDKQGSYILNSKDLCLIEKLPELAKAGVCSFKIEGRNKTVGYLAMIVRAYRRALDDFANKKSFDKKLWKEIYSTGNREFTLGFFDGSLQNLQNYERSAAENPQSFLGLVEKTRSGGSQTSDCFIFLQPKNRFGVGDVVEIVIPKSEVIRAKVVSIKNEKNEELEKAHGGQKEKVWVKLKLLVKSKERKSAVARSKAKSKGGLSHQEEVPCYTLIRKADV
jgi:U32 family peptidase